MSFRLQVEDVPLAGFYRFDGGWWVRHATTHHTLGTVEHNKHGWHWSPWFPAAQLLLPVWHTATRKAACVALVAWWREQDPERLTAPIEKEVPA